MLLVLSGCSYFFKEQVRDVPQINSSGSQGCVIEANRTIGNFFKADIEADELDGALKTAGECYRTSIDLFLNKVKSKNDGYSAQEIQTVLKTVFSSYQDSQDFVEEMLQLKALVVGGSSSRITKAEFKEISRFMVETTEYLRGLLISRKFMLLQDIGNVSESEFEDAILNFKTRNANFVNFLSGFQKQQNAWMQTDLKLFLQRVFSKYDQVQVGKYWHLFKTSSLLFLNSSAFNHRQLLFQFESTMDTYEQFMRFSYFVKDDAHINHIGRLFIFPMSFNKTLKTQELFKGYRFKQFKILFANIENRINLALKNHPSGVEFEWLRELLFAVDDLGTFANSSLQRESVEEVLRSVIKNYLQYNYYARTGDSLTFSKIKWYFDEFRAWSERQDYINQKMKEGAKKEDLLAVGLPVIDPFLKTLKETNLGHWHEDSSLDISLFKGSRTYKDLTMSNLFYTMVTFFMKPFANGVSNPINFEVKPEEAQKIYEMIRPVGLDLKLVDGRINNSGFRTFQEANLFTSVATNFNTLNFYEGFELLQIMITTGIKYDEFHNRLNQRCVLDEYEILGRRPVFTDCFRENFPGLLSSISGLQGFRSIKEDKEKEKYLYELERAARFGLYFDDPISSSEGRTLLSIAVYTDIVFLRFDQNEDGLLKGEELSKAMDMFVPFVKSLILNIANKANPGYKKTILNYLKDSQYSAHKLIAFLAQNGKLPNLTGVDLFDIKQFLKLVLDEDLAPTNFIFWKRDQWFDSINFTRADLARVVAGVSDFSRETKWRALLQSIDKLYVAGKTLSGLKEEDMDSFVYQFECVNNIKHPEKGILFIREEFKKWLRQSENQWLLGRDTKTLTNEDILKMSRDLIIQVRNIPNFRNYCYPPMEKNEK